MNPLQFVWRCITIVARAVFQDLFSEDGVSGPGAVSTPDGITAERDRLDALQGRLDALQPGLAQLAARVCQMEAEQQRLSDTLGVLDQAVDQALQSGQESQARALLEQYLAVQARAGDLARRREETGQSIRVARGEVEALKQRIQAARQRVDEVYAREQRAVTLEILAGLRRDLDRDLSRLSDDLGRRDTLAARLEDQAVTLNDIERRKR